MKTYPYNRTSIEGRRLFKLLDVQFNPGVLETERAGKAFETYGVPSVMQCRANKVGFLFASNLSGIKRPQVHVESDVELAWGDFAEDITALDFTHGQELPLTYVQPIEDDTMKMLIDAGLYKDERFEELMSKLMTDEVFDAEADMNVTYLDVGKDSEQNEQQDESVPVLLVDPVNVVHDGHDPSEHTTINNLVKRSARLAIELRKEGVNTEEIVKSSQSEQEREVYIEDTFRDVVAQKEEEQIEKDVDNSFKASSELLDREIDVTDELKGSLTFDHTNEDDKIRDLKDRKREDDIAELASDVSQEPVKPDVKRELPKQESESKTTEAKEAMDSDGFGKGLDDYEYEDEDDGPDL